jgi:hypothetical protein
MKKKREKHENQKPGQTIQSVDLLATVQTIISDRFHQKLTLDFPLDSHPSRQLQKPHRKACLGHINILSLSQGI